MFSEETTSALAGFNSDSLSFGDVYFCEGRKTGELGEKPLEQGENQQQIHCTRTDPRPH